MIAYISFLRNRCFCFCFCIYYCCWFTLNLQAGQTDRQRPEQKQTHKLICLFLSLCASISWPISSSKGIMNQNHVLGLNPILRSESFGYYSGDQQNYTNTMMEKRQLFLRSYQFSRKRNFSERIKSSFIRVKRVICLRLRSARRIRKLVCSRLRYGFYYRRRRFLRLLNNHNHNYNKNNSSNCFW